MPLKIIEIGLNEDGEHAMTLVGDADAVKAAAKLWGEPVVVVEESAADPKEVNRANAIIRHQNEQGGKIAAQLAKAEKERDNAHDLIVKATEQLDKAIRALRRIAEEAGGKTGAAFQAQSALSEMGLSYLVTKQVEITPMPFAPEPDPAKVQIVKEAVASWPEEVDKAAQKLVDKAQASWVPHPGDKFVMHNGACSFLPDPAVVASVTPIGDVLTVCKDGEPFLITSETFNLHAQPYKEPAPGCYEGPIFANGDRFEIKGYPGENFRVVGRGAMGLVELRGDNKTPLGLGERDFRKRARLVTYGEALSNG